MQNPYWTNSLEFQLTQGIDVNLPGLLSEALSKGIKRSNL